MPPPIDDISLSEGDASAGQNIETELLRSLREDLLQAENTSFVLSARDAEGRLIGGLVASTSYGWLLVKELWVDKAHRGRSLGRSLMARAEEKARSIGCHGAWLDTSNPDARAFYARLGYEAFGYLANAAGQHPETHRRWFMKKALCNDLT